MQILRVPPYDSMVLTLEEPIEIPENYLYTVYAVDMADFSETILASRELVITPSYTYETLPAVTISEINVSDLNKYDTSYKLITKTLSIKYFVNWNTSEMRNVLLNWKQAMDAYKQSNGDPVLLAELEDIENSDEYIEAKEYFEFALEWINTDSNYMFLNDEQYFDVVRPYINPNNKGTTASEIATYASNEELARAIIDSVCDVEFYYKKKVIQTTGQGTDYLPIWVDAKKVLKVYENNVLLYNADDLENSVSAFEIIPDGSAITMTFNDAINRDESARILLPASPTDITELDYSARGFPKTWDYTIVLEVGYNKVPSDIIRATELLIHDIDCGKLDYYKRYIGAYNTDQFRIQFDKAVFEGTGNLIVDKILDKYRKPIEFVGVL